jgi:hypothetical protein
MARVDEPARALGPPRPQHLVVERRAERRLESRSDEMGGADLLVLRVEDRRLDRASQELRRVPAEELVEAVLAGHADG